MNKIIKFVFFSLLCSSIIQAEDKENLLSNYNLKFHKYINCTFDTLLHLDVQELDQLILPSWEEVFAPGPIQFDIDSTSIYFHDYGYLYKYDYHKDSLVWSKVDRGILAFKYHNKQIYIYSKDKLIIYNADDGQHLKDISLTKFKVNTIGALNQCFFFDKYFFLAEDDFPKDFRLYIKYMYDMEQNRFINTMEDNLYDYYPITNCTNCDASFRLDLFDAQKWSRFLGQSDNYIFFEVSCLSTTDPNCPEERLHVPCIYKKSDNSFCVLDQELNRDKYKFSYLTDKAHTKFLNDTTFVYQARRFKYIPDENRYKGTDLIYVKATFRTW